MGKKIRLFVVDYEVCNPALVHANSEPVVGEGTLCGIKYMDFTAPNSASKDRKGRKIFEITNDQINCPHCIAYLETLSTYRKTEDGWK